MNDNSHLNEWLKLSNEQKINVFTKAGEKIGLSAMAIEKDWWVVHTLSLISSMDCAGSLIFKGGTSLSKGWNLIQRFSEDIDLALDRSFLGFPEQLAKAEIRRLRKRSFEYVTNIFVKELAEKFKKVGFDDVEVKDRKVDNHDQDPTIVEIYYPKLTETDSYMKPGVLVEIGFRSLGEPFTNMLFRSMVAENFPSESFADKLITISTVNPERTFLEKIFLLHEEHQRPQEKIRVERMSRHLYDIEKISKSEYGKKALEDPDLYQTIVAHRKKFTHIAGIDYNWHAPASLRFVPPDSLLGEWKSDYNKMIENMIYGDSLEFDDLIQQLTNLQTQFNALDWKINIED